MDATIEMRVQRLEDTEALRQLKARYTWLMDHKLWDEWKTCFSTEFAFEGVGYKLGLDEFVPVVSASLEPLVTSHQLHQFMVEFTSDTTATGTWWLRDHLVHAEKGSDFRGRAYYKEEYVKEAGEWKIYRSVLEYINNEGHVLTAGPETVAAIGLVMPTAASGS